MTIRILSVALLALAVASCSNYDYKKTKEGIVYKIYSNGKGELVKPGSFLKVHYSSRIGDSTFFSTYEHIPAYGMYDTTYKGAYDFIDFLGEMRIGDSAVYIRSVDSLVKRGQAQYDSIFKKGGSIKGTVKVVALLKDESAMREDQQKEAELEKQREIAGLEAFLKKQKITNAVKTDNGVFVVMEKPGDAPRADSGMEVTVNYTGRLKNGKVFDSNTDTAFQHVQPFTFVVGARQVIQGWDEGIRQFGVGGKGKMYIPAMLAYGQQSQGERMPAFSDLVFDIEVTNVATPAPSAVPPAATEEHDHPGGH
jgi:FKBP-type peptidyl-prolyl cis-trans isomerase